MTIDGPQRGVGATQIESGAVSPLIPLERAADVLLGRGPVCRGIRYPLIYPPHGRQLTKFRNG